MSARAEGAGALGHYENEGGAGGGHRVGSMADATPFGNPAGAMPRWAWFA